MPQEIAFAASPLANLNPAVNYALREPGLAPYGSVACAKAIASASLAISTSRQLHYSQCLHSAVIGLICSTGTISMNSQDMQDVMRSEERKRRRRDWALTPAERLERHFQLQSLAAQILKSNPTALAAFHQRNRQRRTQSQVRAFVVRLRLPENLISDTTKANDA